MNEATLDYLTQRLERKESAVKTYQMSVNYWKEKAIKLKVEKDGVEAAEKMVIEATKLGMY